MGHNPLSVLYCVTLTQPTSNSTQLFSSCFLLSMVKKMRIRTHVDEFLDICSTFKFQNISDESVRLRLFVFSLKDQARA